MATVLTLTPLEREELEARRRFSPIKEIGERRARLILMLAEGKSYAEIQAQLGCPATYIARWKKRFEVDRLAGLYKRNPGRPPERAQQIATRVLEVARRCPRDGSAKWSVRKLARQLKTNKSIIHRTLRQMDCELLGVRDLKYAYRPDDSEFKGSVVDVVGLYLAPGHHAAVFSLANRRSVKAALRRRALKLKTAPRGRGRGKESPLGGGVDSMYSALRLSLRNGAKSRRRCNNVDEFLAFVSLVLATQPSHRKKVVLLDSVDPRRRAELYLRELKRNMLLTIAPTYRLWLAQVDLWFTRATADRAAITGSASGRDVRRNAMHYIRKQAVLGRSLKWAAVQH